MPRRVDFEFPVRGTGGCSACLGARAVLLMEAVRASLTQVQLSAEAGACRRHLLAHPLSKQELFRAYSIFRAPIGLAQAGHQLANRMC